MSKSVAELRAEKAEKPTDARRPERSMTLCLAPDLVAEVESLTTRLGDLPTPKPNETNEDGEPVGPPAKMGDPVAAARARELAEARTEGAEIRARLTGLLEEMAEHEGEMRLRANLTDGEWRRWVNEHPPRGEDVPGHDRDQRVAANVCNADDLIDTLGSFVHEWNGEPITAEDWSVVFEPDVGSGDIAEMASTVIGLYEGRLDFPRLRSAWSTSLKRLSDSDSPAT